jgi:FKBP-type peptidyl-prolyl cis-trans isomerase FklB
MRRLLFSMSVSCLVCSVAGTTDRSQPVKEAETLGYSIGYQVGGDVRQQSLSVNPEMVIQGVLDALAGSEPLMTGEEMERVLIKMQRLAESAAERQRSELAERNLASGVEFLAENAKNEDVETLPSGLQFRIIEKGSGPTPTTADTVTVHYRGTLIDGSEFDSSFSRGEPAKFGIDGVIAGWSEALLRMREGARWQLFVPPELGYGEQAPDRVGPNSTLIFEIELITVHAAE